MKRLLIVTTLIETGAGLALLSAPSAMVGLLLGSPLGTPAAVTLGRLAGVALLALGVACWFACHDTQSRAARGVLAAMTAYNLGAVIILGAAGIGTRPTGIALWPAVALHAGMAVWCVACLRSKPTQITEQTSRNEEDQKS